MLRETFGLAACFALSGLIGLGPALKLLTPGPRRLPRAVAIAPALGLAIIGLIGFPLVRWAAPVQTWAWPVTVVLAAVSAALLWHDWRRRRAEYAALAWRRSLAAAAWVGAGLVVLAAPLALRGVQYAIYRSNPSDAFLYMSLAETLRVVDWSTLLSGAALTHDNWANLTALAQTSPTALFTARLVEWPLAVNHMAGLAWSASVAGAAVPQFYYAHHLLALAAVLPLTLALGDVLKLPGWLNALGGLAVAVGFWARLILETDSGYEIAALPMVLLAVFGWMQLEEAAPRTFSGARALLALAAAVIACIYAPPALVIVLGGASYYGLGLAQRAVRLPAVLRHGVTAGLAAGLLVITGQADYIVRQTASLISRAPNERNFAAPAMDLIEADGVAALWGLPGTVLWGARPTLIRWPLNLLAGGLGVGLSLVLAAAAVLAARREAPPAARIVVILAGAGLLLALVMYIAGNGRAAGKAVTYVYPFLTLGVLLPFGPLRGRWPSGLHRVLLGGVALWLALQAGLGLWLPFRGRSNFLGQPPKPHVYDLTPITRALDAAQPTYLLVNIPRDETWMFAYYSQFVFGRYPAYFQSGLIVDNNTRYQSLWFETLERAPDYAVVLTSVDYIGPAGLGVKLAETADLVLYQIVSADLEPFLARDRQAREQEQLKPVFPSLSE